MFPSRAKHWLVPLTEALARGEAATLVHVVAVKGSAPREAGAQMLVMEHALFGTIGGGQLEEAATRLARELLVCGRATLTEQALGPDLNQCCGGFVRLAYEPFAPADRAWVERLAAAASGPGPVQRLLQIASGGRMRREWRQGGSGDPAFAAEASGDRIEIRECVNPPAHEVWLFGAGHVGRALARALHPLGFALTWIDGRSGQLPKPPLAGVRQLELAMPELIVDEAGPGTMFLVMTHSHPLDEAICEAVLRREDFGYLGLIGSETKAARFRRRLAMAGLEPKAVARLDCPVGLPGIRSKEPAHIAASIAADLLMRQEELRMERERRAAIVG